MTRPHPASAPQPPSDGALAHPAYICERGHVTPYEGSQWRVIRCPERIAARMQCGAEARYQEPTEGER